MMRGVSPYQFGPRHEVPADEIAHVKGLETFFEGRVVFDGDNA